MYMYINMDRVCYSYYLQHVHVYSTRLYRSCTHNNTGEERRTGHTQGSATATVGTISTLLVILIIAIAAGVTVQISYKLATRKKGYD